jgi:hypothetical protein
MREVQPASLPDEERAALLAVTDDDLPRLWNHLAASAETPERILRAVFNELVVKLELDRLHLMLDWQGSDITHDSKS